MKAVKLIVAVLIIVSLVAISRGITEESLANDNGNEIMSTIAIHAAAPTVSSTSNADRQGIENASVADSSLPDSAAAIQPDPPIPNDPYFDNQWALSQIQALKLWQVTTGNREILVAVLDTGIDQNHEDLNGKVVAEINFTDSSAADDVNGHGTHIAGIIVAGSNNGIGIAGLAPESRLLNVKVADDKGRCRPSMVAEGIVWAVDNGASVISVSVQFREPSPELEEAVNYAWSQGAVIIAAAGNNGNESPIYPACYENSIAVAATRQNDTLAPLSNYGDWVDVAAPGFNVYSTLPDNGYGYKSGTSFATAYVSGLAALLFDVVTDTNGDGRLNDEVRAAIEAGCQETGVNGVGNGRIDAASTLAEISYTP